MSTHNEPSDTSSALKRFFRGTLRSKLPRTPPEGSPRPDARDAAHQDKAKPISAALRHLLHPHQHAGGPARQLPLQDPAAKELSQRALHTSLYVKVVGASGLPAADVNGLADPYVAINVADRRATSRAEQKTLCPVWDEIFVFEPPDVAAALQEEVPRIEFRVFDKDLLSADDFLGRADLPLASLQHESGSGVVVALQLHAEGRDGCASPRHMRDKRGVLHVSAWFGCAAGGGDEAAAVATLMPQPGAAVAPKVLHAGSGSSCMYEEPLFVGLAIRVGEIACLFPAGEGSVAAAGHTGSGNGGIAGGTSAGYSPGAAAPDETSVGTAAPPVGRAWPLGGWRARWSAVLRGRRCALSRAKATCGADAWEGDEGGEALHPGGLAFDDAGGAEEWDALSAASEEAGDNGEGVPGDAGAAREAGPLRLAQYAAAPTGKYLYCRLVLGTQAQVTQVVKERAGGVAVWRQQLAFAAPLPLRDRTVRFEVYRTSSPQRKGRAIHAAQVALLDLLPPLEGAGADLAARRRLEVPLVALPAGDHVSVMRVSGAVVDLDCRRALYGQAFLEPSSRPLPESLPERAAAAAAAAEPSYLDPIGRLQSSTAALKPRDLRRMARLSEGDVAAWEAGLQRRRATAQFVWGSPGALALAAEMWAQWGYARMRDAATWCAGTAGWQWDAGQQQPGGVGASAAEASVAPSVAGARAPLAAAAAATQPLACLRLELHELHLPRDLAGWSASYNYLFCVAKVGPCWLRSAVVAAGRDAPVALGMSAELPVFDPSTLLLLAVFDMRFKGGTRRFTTAAGAPRMVGKLRVRLSTIDADRDITASLPLLADRKRGGKRVGAAAITLRLTFSSPAARLASYFKPALPRECYDHGVDASQLQQTLDLDRRRMVLRWLDAASPPVQRAVALSVLDTEREEFSRSRLSANARRIRLAAAALGGAWRFLRRVQSWRDPWLSLATCAACIGLAYRPRLALPALLLWAAAACVLGRPPTAGLPFGMEEDPDEEAEEAEKEERELDAEVASYRVLTRKVLALRRITLRLENALDDVAALLERAVALFTWQDPLVTAVAVGAMVGAAALIVVLGPRPLQTLLMLWIVRPPRLRTPTPPPPKALFMRLPTQGDRIV